MVVKTRKFAEIKEDEISKISLSIATNEDIREWSHGEVTSPETINYKTYKPEKGGLFDEVIFGPTTNFKCPICGTKYKRFNKGQICEKTDECKQVQPEILPSSSRRTRMGHIELASPVVHFWFFKIDNSIITKLLGLKPEGSNKLHTRNAIENIIYFKSHIVLESGGIKALSKNDIIDINYAPIKYRDALKEIINKYEEGSQEYEEIKTAIKDLEEKATSKIGKYYGVDFYELNEIIEEHSDAKISTGAKAIEYLLENFDIKLAIKVVKTQITKLNNESITDSKKTKLKKLYKRLEVLSSFNKSGQSLTSMLIYSLSVLPADLRPLIQIDGGRHSTTDVNELYRRIIIRNNRLKKWNELDAPILIKQNELRMLQEAVDALIDNARKKPSPVISKDSRPLKSISDSLSGKKGRFRQNLLGKRVDYSGRSVIVVGPTLKMHQVGIPREMAAKLFEPWIISLLVKYEVASSIKIAKKMIEQQNNIIWPYVEKAIKGKVVLLNRAPTLHRLSIQAFLPVIVRGKAIKLHPLVTTAFNADFDGDQMAVHVPISDDSIREARELMLANKNILGPKDGEPIINPSQDMILGLYYLTKEVKGAKGEGNIYSSYEEMYKAYDFGHVDLHARVAIPIINLDKEILLEKNDNALIVSTVGKFIFNKSFPTNFPFIFDNSKETLKDSNNNYLIEANKNINVKEFIDNLKINEPFNKKDIAKIARYVFEQYNSLISKEDITYIIKKLNPTLAKDTVMKFADLKDYEGNKLNNIHCRILSSFVSEHYLNILNKIKIINNGVERPFEKDEKVELLEKVWFDYTNVVAKTMDNIKKLGFKYSTISGTTMSIYDIQKSKTKNRLVNEGNSYINKLKEMYKKGLITNDEKYQLTIKKWTEVKNNVENDLKVEIKKNKNNPIFVMMNSGARGNISNFVQLAGLRGLMTNNKKTTKATAETSTLVRSTIEIPVKSSFLEGLTAYEFYSSTHGARKGLTDTALNTAEAGYLTRRLVDASQNIIVSENDCLTTKGSIVKVIMDQKTKTVIVPLIERIEGRHLFEDIKNKKGELIAKNGDYITQEIAEKIIKANISQVLIRTVFGCQSRESVCKKCYGKDLAKNRIVEIGEAVGIIAAQSIGEPGTQLTMRTFHTGGVAGVIDITGGFARLKQLVDATNPWGKNALISRIYGKVIKIVKGTKFETKLKDKNVILISKKTAKNNDKKNTIKTIIYVEEEKTKKVYCYWMSGINHQIRVKVKNLVKPGSKLIEGPINLKELLAHAGVEETQKYLLKEIQRLYRMQGIAISDKYVEIIIRQMLSKVIIKDSGDSKYYSGQIVDVFDYENDKEKLIAKDKIPPVATPEIIGIKQLPLLSNSFLASASYQETAKVLVKASIKRKLDDLGGFKENIIIGHKIPAGTNFDFEKKGKYDIRDPYSYFLTRKEKSKINKLIPETDFKSIEKDIEEFNSAEIT